MPRNCCVPLCATNARKDPTVKYHEFPCELQRREAWLKNISRQGLSGKGSKWEPSDRSLVCSLHFTENDYKKNTKVRLLLPTAVPTVFDKYPQYMQKENVDLRKRQRRNFTDSTVVGVGHESGNLGESANVSESLVHSPSDEVEALNPVAGIEPCGCPVDQACQTTLDFVHVLQEAKKVENRLKRKAARQGKQLQKLQTELDDTKELLQVYRDNKETQAFLRVLKEAEKGDKAAAFIRNQVAIFNKKKPAYNEGILRECVLWKACSNKGYEHVRSRGLLKLPCRATLQNYVGHSTGEIGVTSLIRERLRVEHEGLAVEQEAYCSLIVDEMSISQKVVYDRQVDKIFGLVDMGPEDQPSTAPQVANRLLCFVLRGLSTAYVIPVGYFFTRCLKNDKLSTMTMEVMKAVEDVGFRVLRIVTDNHQTNVALFKGLSEDGTLAHAVPHPLRTGHPLFLSFDPNHLIKNLRTNFLEREMTDGESLIQGGFYLKKLFEIQSQLLVKPVRFLTRAHVEPNNLEKMKVCRATQIFSAPTVATLQFLQENPNCHPDAGQFKDSSATISFMRMVAKWYALHDIGAVKARGWGKHEEPFAVTDDERLSWLELDFICYLEDLQMNGGRLKRMTKETYEATLLTTRSTVALIEYLLDQLNFRYVLTRGLNSDPVESLFSCLRQFNGGNDRVDARTAVFTAEKLLKVGILQAARSGNAPTSFEMKAPLRLAISDAETSSLPAAVEFATRELCSELGFLTLSSEADLEVAPVAFLAGYVARACKEKV
uniref:Putative tick transposon n=1 Tax=Amblyomma aureolatum TaxID=187763 RepID=A0A1E1X262_9ACAR